MDTLYDWLSPERVHLAVSHLPLTGLLIATVALLLATAIGRRGVLIVSLVLVLLTTASVALVVDSGEATMQAIDADATRKQAMDPVSYEWLQRYQSRAEFWSWPLLGIAVLALVSIGLAAWRPRDIGRYAGGVMSLLCIAGIASMAWVTDAAVKAYHPNLRAAAEMAAIADDGADHEIATESSPTPDQDTAPAATLEEDTPQPPEPAATPESPAAPSDDAPPQMPDASDLPADDELPADPLP
ncbi:MAG: hypothetical protein AAGB29_00185 [Planctomycetota bacterium]